MAKKTTKVEEAVTSLELEGVNPETVTTKEEIKKRIIIAKTATPFRKSTTLEYKQIVGTMPVGVAYEIVKEVKSKIYGDFYLLNNGYYITKNGNYSLN